MKKFVVLFCIPGDTMQEWMKTVSEEERKSQTEKMMQDWQKWTTDHETMIVDKGMPVGKTMRVTKDGVESARNDVNWYLVLEAASQEEATDAVKSNPHLQIPGSYVDVSESNMGGM
jgi:hypothetical protein